MIEYKENLSKTEFEQAINEAKEGLFTKDDLNKKISEATTGLISKEGVISLDEHNNEVKGYKSTIKELEQYKPKEKTDLELKMEQITKENKLYKTKEMFEKSKLPKELANYISLNLDDEKEVKKNLDTLETIFKSYGENSVKEFKPSGFKGSSGDITKDQFNNMSYAERSKLYETNKDLYTELSK